MIALSDALFRSSDKYDFKDDAVHDDIVVKPAVKLAKEPPKSDPQCGRCENCLRKDDCGEGCMPVTLAFIVVVTESSVT